MRQERPRGELGKISSFGGYLLNKRSLRNGQNWKENFISVTRARDRVAPVEINRCAENADSIGDNFPEENFICSKRKTNYTDGIYLRDDNVKTIFRAVRISGHAEKGALRVNADLLSRPISCLASNASSESIPTRRNFQVPN